VTANSLLRTKVSSHTEWENRPVIALADANDETRETLRIMLEGVNAKIHEVNDGGALQQLLDAVPVDLVLTRSQLPRRTGLQVLAHQRANGNATPFIVVHSFHQPLLRVFVSESASQSVLATRTVNADNLTDLVIRLVRPTCAAAVAQNHLPQ
jgi:CheY-like chemotaxis protein